MKCDTLTCVKAEAPVKTEGDTVAGQQDYTVVDTLIEVQVEVLGYAQANTFSQLQAKSFTDSLTPYYR